MDASKQRGFGLIVFHWDNPWNGEHIAITDVSPIMFLSKILTKAEPKYGATELEVGCLV